MSVNLTILCHSVRYIFSSCRVFDAVNNDIRVTNCLFLFQNNMYIHVHVGTMPFWNRKRQLVESVYIVSSAKVAEGRLRGSDE